MTCSKHSAFRPASHAWLLVAGIALAVAVPPAIAFAADPGAGAIQFSLVDLGTLGGLESHAIAINKYGQVAGNSTTRTGETHGFLWENGVMTDLGTLGGNSSTVAALNDKGQVVGESTLASGETHAFLWSDGVMIDLGSLGGETRAKAINNRGQVVGVSTVVTPSLSAPHAFLWEDGSMIDLGTLGGSTSYAVLINDAGQVAGISDASSGELHGFLWADGRMADVTVGDAGATCGCGALVWGLNGRGQVVGDETRSVPAPPGQNPGFIQDAFVWENGTKRIIAAGDVSTGYSARRINDRGEISGTRTSNNPPGVGYLFFWRDGTMQEWTLGGVFGFGGNTTAAINKFGQVVGQGITPDGDTRGYFWHDGRLTELGNPLTWAMDVNDQGVVVGSAYVPTSGVHAALWNPIGPVAPRIVPAD